MDTLRSGVLSPVVRCVVTVLLSTVLVVPLGAAGPIKVHEHRAKAGEFLVKFRAHVGDEQAQAAARSAGAREVHKFRLPRGAKTRSAMNQWRLVKLPPGAAKQAHKRLAADPAVEYVEPNYAVSITAAPNDPRFGELWGLHNTGQTGGLADADIDAMEAWNVTTGSDSVVVAVIDTGVDYTHPDLAANIWVNPGEIPGNGIDDDGNGYVDDVRGYDFVNRDNDPSDDHGHGTHVAGIIAGVGGNGTGVTGVAWRAKIMPVKFIDASGNGNVSDAVSAVLYAAAMRARIMNNSWGGEGYSQALRDAILVANDANALFVASAGNDGLNNDDYPKYPSGYDAPNVLAVAATDHADSRASFSNYGVVSVDLGAPGVGILSSVPAAGDICCSDPSGYLRLDGTSMAAPHVSGAAALLIAQEPARSAVALKKRLMATADPVRGLNGITATGGRLNVHSALTCQPAQLRVEIERPSPAFTAYLDDPTPVRAAVTTCGDPVAGAAVSAAFNNGESNLSLYDDGRHGDGAANDGIYGATWTPTIDGAVTITASTHHSVLGSHSGSVSGKVRQRFTYRYEAVPFQWIDTTGGTRHTLYDDSSVTIPLGFAVEFYGVRHANITISSNGFVSFLGTSGGSYMNTRLPTSTAPNGLIAPYWTDLNPGSGGGVYSLLEGSAPNRRMTVAWVDVPYFPNVGAGSFQVTIYEDTGAVVFRYLDVDFGNASYNYGATATVGVEEQDGVFATQYSYYQAILQNRTALRFVPGPYNRPPVANAGGPYAGVANQPVTFDGTRSADPEGDALSYRWTFNDGGTATGPAPVHVFTGKGSHGATLIVNDGFSDSAPATAAVTLTNRAPVAVLAGDTTGRRGYPVNFDLAGTHDPDGDVLWYRWDFGNGLGRVDHPAPVTQYTYMQLGTYTVTLTVSDGQLDSAPARLAVTVVNAPPTADAGPDQTVRRGASVLLSSRSSDVDGSILRHQWRQVSGPPVLLTGANSAVATFSAPSPKSGSRLQLVFELTVTDNDGASASDQVAVTVAK